MSLVLIPETAPFTAEQRAWLNGFLAGWVGLQPGDAPPAGLAPAPAPGPEAPAEDFPWHDPALSLDDRLALAEGRPPERRLMAAMAQLDCGACGYDCRTYAEALASGTEARPTLCAPGGGATARAVKALLRGNGAASSAAPAATPAAAREPASHTAFLVSSTNLNGPGSDKRTHHVEIDLGPGGPSYRAGDALGVHPTNCPELVAEVLGALGASGDEPAPTPSGAAPIREVLARDACLATAEDGLLMLLAESATSRREADALRSLIDDPGPISGRDVLDLLRLFPSARPDPGAFVAALGALRPRLYSISSSPTAHGRSGRVHLTVGRVAYEGHGRARKGVASTMLADRLAPGDAVRVFVKEAHGFRLPDDPSAPVVMIGPGTGIAPFRAFLHERQATGAAGPNWLFFGDRRRDADFLYEDELRGFLGSGLLTRLDLAFSRDSASKDYVQHRMLEAAPELFRWLEDGAYLYVCGDAKRMARDVDLALHRVVAGASGRTDDDAKDYVRTLARQGRYRRDVY